MFKIYNEEKGKLTWRLWVILLFEFLGTFAMVLQIVSPTAFNLSSNSVYAEIFGWNITKAIWVASFILLLIFICRKVSVNLNPAVTMAEIAYGNTGVIQGIWMMLFQVMGGLMAGEAAHLIAVHIGTWHANSTLDSVAPNLEFKYLFGGAFNITMPAQFDWLKNAPTGAGWFYGLVPFFIEAGLTFSLLASICYGGKKINHNVRAFIIFGTLVAIVTVGIPTDNIALNPARLIGPAISAELNGGAKTLQYSWIFFMGEMFAVIIFWYIESLKKQKNGDTMTGVRKELRIAYAEILTTKARYSWVNDGHQPLENMSKDELSKVSKKLGIFDPSKEEKEEIEYDVLEYLIFGLEKDKKKKAPVKTELKPVVKTEAKKDPVKTEAKKPVVKTETKKAPVKTVTKKPVAKKTTLSAAEIAKRDAKRKALQEKAKKSKTGSKISSEELKKIKLTDIYGVGPKTEAYFIKSGIDSIIKLSKQNVETMTEKFIKELPTLKSFKYDDKKQKIVDIVLESKYIIKELIK